MNGLKTATSLRHIFIFLLFGTLLAACNPKSGSAVMPGIGGQPAVVDIVDATAGDSGEPLAKGDRGPTQLRGRVAFGDTGLPLRSSVLFATDSADTGDDGFFTADIPRGETEFVISNLLGPARGTFMHDGAGETLFRYPVFDEFDTVGFNRLLTDASRTATIRWPVGVRIPVWIKSSRGDGGTARGRSTAEDAFDEWQSVLRNSVIFSVNSPPAEARESGIVVEFVPEKQVPNPSKGIPRGSIGYCTITFHPDSRIILRGTIVIAQEWQTEIALHRHEIGHCIGLTHSNSSEDVMWPYLDNGKKELSNREMQMARLLYLIPVGTRPLPTTEGRVMPMSFPRNTTYNDDGTVTVIIPTIGPAEPEAPPV